ncbi:hypothetical protein [Litoribacillus peritrichatus]|uniref:hypothetical protein n=1 Tax=Litoribacillus peritrichatus TaxID=718191 RepID=UPI0031D6758D
MKSVVFVYYGSSIRVKAFNSLGRFLFKNRYVSIDNRIEENNRSFEFGGYESGLSQLKALNLPVYSVLFLNDTALKKHFFLSFWVMFLILILKPYEKKTVLGIERNFKCSEGNIIRYFTTWLFRIDYDQEIEVKLPCTKFFDFDFNGDISQEIQSAIIGWLYPKSLFAGWDGASPYKNISESTFLRKRYAISQELLIQSRLSDIGIKLKDMSRLFLLMDILDLFYLRAIKIFSRLNQYLKYKIVNDHD